MGKPIQESYREIDECIQMLDYYTNHSEGFVDDSKINLSTGQSATVVHQPLGPVLGKYKLPYNKLNSDYALELPYLVAFQVLHPTHGVGKLYHAQALRINSQVRHPFRRNIQRSVSNFINCLTSICSGFGKGEYSNMHIDYAQCEQIIADRRVRALKFTGSTPNGKKVAQLCGKYMKKSFFNLGGNDPFVVLKEANIEKAVNLGFESRMANNGQGCLNAKRFIINEQVYDQFKDCLIEKIKSEVRIGDPMDPETTLGPLATAK